MILKSNSEMAPSCIDLDITEERRPCFDYQIFPLSHRQCDYYDKFDKPIQILVAFTSVLVQLYVNYVLECLLKLDVTLQDEKKLIEIVYTYASDLRYNFFLWKQIIVSFMIYLICFMKNTMWVLICCYENNNSHE